MNANNTFQPLLFFTQILTVAVLAILIAAPIGAAATMITGPRLLKDTLEAPPDAECPTETENTKEEDSQETKS